MNAGKIAYDAYCDARNWRSVRGERLPAYEDQSDELKVAWERAAYTVLQTVAAPNGETFTLEDVIRWHELHNLARMEDLPPESKDWGWVKLRKALESVWAETSEKLVAEGAMKVKGRKPDGSLLSVEMVPYWFLPEEERKKRN